MSVEALAMVMYHSQSTSNARLVMIAIANHDGDGGAWPTIETIARLANCSERTVQRCLPELVELGELVIEPQAGGTRKTPSRYRPNRYEIDIVCPPECDGTMNHRLTDIPDSRGDNAVTPHRSAGVTPLSPVKTDRGDNPGSQGVTLLSPEPSYNQPSTPQPPASGGQSSGRLTIVGSPSARPSAESPCDPVTKPHTNCRGCRSTKKLLHADAEKAAAEQKRLDVQKRNREEAAAAAAARSTPRSPAVDVLIRDTRRELRGGAQ